MSVDGRTGTDHCSPAMTATLANATSRPLLPILVGLVFTLYAGTRPSKA